jgi:hypothetical protein
MVLSSADQALKDAVLALYSDENVRQFGWQLDALTVAAALRAVADQVVPETLRECETYTNEAIRLNLQAVRYKICAIADEPAQ